MNASKFSYVTPNQILSDVLKVVADEGFRMNTKGWYTSQMQQALTEMAFDTYFDERSESFDIPSNNRLEMPKGAFNIKNMYLYNGDECVIANSVPVYHKRNFINSKSGQGYVANNKGQNPSGGFYKDTVGQETPNGLHFYSVQNGMIMLSSNCSSYDKLFIQYSGTGVEIGEVPYIPMFIRQAVKDYVTVEALIVRMGNSPAAELNRWSSLLSRYENSLDMPEMREGSWGKACRRLRKLDFKERNDIKERMQKMYY